MSKYKIIEAWVGPMQKLVRTIINQETGGMFPDPSPDNIDYQQYLVWVSEGNVAPVEEMITIDPQA